MITSKYHVAISSLLSILLEVNKCMTGFEPLERKLCLAGDDVQYLVPIPGERILQ